MYWFTSDQHYNHENIITKFVFRPFANANHKNSELIKRHNDRVKQGHTVFHLGDFKLTTNRPCSHKLKKMLNGNHVFLQGNHDKNNGNNSPIRHIVIEAYSSKVILTHKPEDAIELMKTLNINLAFVGHVHTDWKFLSTEYGNLINVGVDQWNYYPVDVKQIFKAYKKWEKG